jgi:thiamine biosynthesis lipoprotein
MKNLILAFFLLTFWSCQEKGYITLSGETMGTYYSIQYKSERNFQNEIESLLREFVSAASTYDSLSELSEFNRKGIVYFRTRHLYRMLVTAKIIHKETLGAFEPTLMPLINLHGFGYMKKVSFPASAIDSLLELVSFNHVVFDSIKMTTLKKGVQVDLSAMGEGFAIDLIAEFLEENHVINYKVEIGGEIKCKGKNSHGENWLIGIEHPVPDNPRRILNTVRLQNEAISTSGGYRKFYLDDKGRKHSHIVDPKTGKSVQNNVLSVTIIAKKAVTADAFATACMVMGLTDAVRFIESSAIEGMITYEHDGKIQYWYSKDFMALNENDSVGINGEHETVQYLSKKKKPL